MDDSRYNVDQVLGIIERYSRHPNLRDLAPDSPDDVSDYNVWLCSWADEIVETIMAQQEWIEDSFSFRTTEDDWRRLNQSNPTIRDVAEFIAERAPKRPVAPINILGRDCCEAGILRELELASEHIVGAELRVGPSTTLAGTLSKRDLQRLAHRVVFLWPEVVRRPGILHRYWLGSWIKITFYVLLCLTVLGMTLIALAAPFGAHGLTNALGRVLLDSAVLYIAPALLALVAVGCIGNAGKGPFDSRIRTYRDLVEQLMTFDRFTRAPA